MVFNSDYEGRSTEWIKSRVGRARLFALRPTIRMLGNGEAVAQPTWLFGVLRFTVCAGCLFQVRAW